MMTVSACICPNILLYTLVSTHQCSLMCQQQARESIAFRVHSSSSSHSCSSSRSRRRPSRTRAVLIVVRPLQGLSDALSLQVDIFDSVLPDRRVQSTVLLPSFEELVLVFLSHFKSNFLEPSTPWARDTSFEQTKFCAHTRS